MADRFEDLERLARMLDEGKLNQEEFDQMKAELLARPDEPLEAQHPMAGKPVGWYDDPSGKNVGYQAFWDGREWTGETRPKPAPQKPSVARSAGAALGRKAPGLDRALPAAGPDKPNPWYTRKGFLLVVAIVVLIIVANLGSGGGSSPAGGGSGGVTVQHEAVEAYVVCQQFVEDRLKAPSTAEFGGPYSQVTAHNGGGRYTVDTYVDAQNSFGAMIRTDFTCVVQHKSGDTYTLVSLDMDE